MNTSRDDQRAFDAIPKRNLVAVYLWPAFGSALSALLFLTASGPEMTEALASAG